MTGRASQVRIEPAPTPEEAAAIVAALEVLREHGGDEFVPPRSFWGTGDRTPWGVGGSVWSRWDREGF